MLSYIKIEDYVLWQNLLTSFENKERMQNRIYIYVLSYMCYVPTSVAQLDAHPTGDQEVAGSTPAGRQHSFVEIDHEIFCMVILSLPLIQEGQSSVSGERMCTILVNCL